MLLLATGCATEAAPLVWPNRAIAYTLEAPDAASELIVAFDERGRPLSEIDLRTSNRWSRSYQGDFRVDEVRIAAGRPRATYQANLVDELPATATATELFPDLAITTNYIWDWDNGAAQPFLKTVTAHTGASTTISTYSANQTGYQIGSCTDRRCTTFFYRGDYDYLGGPDRWTERAIECPDGSQLVLDQRSFDVNDQVLVWRSRSHGDLPSTLCSDPPTSWSAESRWQRDADGVPQRLEERDASGTRVVEYFVR